MFLQVIIASAIGIGLIQLGALSVWVAVMSLVLKVLLVAALIAAVYFGVPHLLRRFKVSE